MVIHNWTNLECLNWIGKAPASKTWWIFGGFHGRNAGMKQEKWRNLQILAMIQQASWDSTHQGIHMTLLSKDCGGTNMEELYFIPTMQKTYEHWEFG
jgi:hypothetical protein